MTPAVGTGPGAITADGCSVDVYAALPAGVEPDVVAAAVPPPAWLLELGAGAGRVTHALIAQGFHVVAVDDSPEMLARITGAETVLASIEGLDLDRRFDGVLLCSHLINSPEPQRDAFIATCARHVASDGCVVIERHEPAWFDEAEAVTVEVGGVVMSLGEIAHPAPGKLSAVLTYRIGDQTWTHRFTTECVDDAQIAALLDRHRLRFDRWLDSAGRWIRAVPISGASA